MRFLYAVILFFVLVLPCFARDKAVDPSIIYDELLKASNYKLVKYNAPAGSRELDLFNLSTKRQYNINAVASPDFDNLVYSEVYFYPDPRVTACALYIVPLPQGLDKTETILSVSTKDKNQIPIIETDYAKLYPFKFNTFTPVDWNKNSDKILFKEKLGQHYDQIFLTKLYLYDLSTGKMHDLNIVRTQIIEYWASQGLYLSNLKWDIKPLGFLEKSQDRVGVIAYGYNKNERKFLGFWIVDTLGSYAYKTDYTEKAFPQISANGKCLKFIPDIADIVARQRRQDEKYNKTIHIEPK